MSALSVRAILTAARTYYVRSDGSDSNTGLSDSAGGAFLTWQHAVDVAAGLDFGGQIVTIQHGSEASPKTFSDSVSIPTLSGGGQLYISGSTTPGYTIFDGSSLSPFTQDASGETPVIYTNCTLTGGGQGLIQVNYASKAVISSGVIFGANGSFAGAHIYLHDRQALASALTTSYSITGSAAYHVAINGGFFFMEATTITQSGTPAFSAFVLVQNGGGLQTTGCVFNGGCTGSRYQASLNGAINTFAGTSTGTAGGSGANYFPGDSAGSTATGGQYV